MRQSKVPWRDISSAVEASLSVDYDSSNGRVAAPSLSGSVGQRAAAVGASAGSGVGGSSASASHDQQQQQGQQGLSQPVAGGPQQRQQQIQRIARLVLPTLDASQLDSLVRIGASLPSPDMLMSPEMLSQLLPKLWDSSANPLQSAAGPLDVEQLLGQINSDQQPEGHQQLQGAAAGQSGRRGLQVSGATGEPESAVPGQAGRQGKSREALRSSGGRPAAVWGDKPKKAPKAGTWLSPLKLGQRQMPGEPSPSPQSHVKAVFRDDHDIQFYLPFSGASY